VPVPLKKRVHAPVALMSQSSNVSACMSVYVRAQASAASLQRPLNLSANKYYYYSVLIPPPKASVQSISLVLGELSRRNTDCSARSH
jgi:hypothetical protein